MVQRQAAAIRTSGARPKGEGAPQGSKLERSWLSSASHPGERSARNSSRGTLREEIERIAGTELRQNGVSRSEITALLWPITAPALSLRSLTDTAAFPLQLPPAPIPRSHPSRIAAALFPTRLRHSRSTLPTKTGLALSPLRPSQPLRYTSHSGVHLTPGAHIVWVRGQMHGGLQFRPRKRRGCEGRIRSLVRSFVRSRAPVVRQSDPKTSGSQRFTAVSIWL